MKQQIILSSAPLADSTHNNNGDIVGLATNSQPVLPRWARLPINHCNLPAVLLGSLAFQQHPVALTLDGVAEFHRGLFQLLDQLDSPTERARAFTLHLNAAFYLDQPEQAGYSPRTRHKRHKADYLRMVRGWSFDADGREGAALKGWVESRFGLLPRYHGAPIRDFSSDTYRRYLEMRATALYGTNGLEAQLDLLYTYCQYELARQYPQRTHFTLYRGTNHLDEHETLAQPAPKSRIVLFNNLNSFTANRDRADEFGDHILTTQVPLSKIFCYPALLPNLLRGEEEFTVIGGVFLIREG
jgi:NAD+--dinitrogen-reductase ADP-D-ribosyltransferase